MQLNGKDFESWGQEEIRLLLNNPDYSENDNIEYKQSFTFLNIPDKNVAIRKKNEFRHDICAFANAEGGYIFFGISSENGIAVGLLGIEIPQDDTDKFELDRRNDLSFIQPVVPLVKIRFISIDERNIVVLRVEKGYMRPYVYRENEDKYRFFVRRGNGKRPASYHEVQRMFTESTTLQKEIRDFREQRNLEITDSHNRAAIIQIVPASFIDPSSFVNPYQLLATNKLIYHEYFEHLCDGYSIVPNVDGISYPEYRKGASLNIYYNNILEYVFELEVVVKNEQGGRPREWLRSNPIFSAIKQIIPSTVKLYQKLNLITTSYVCVSVFGCNGVYTEYNEYSDYTGRVDRNMIMCREIEINNTSDNSYIENTIRLQSLATCFALGIKDTKKFCSYDIE